VVRKGIQFVCNGGNFHIYALLIRGTPSHALPKPFYKKVFGFPKISDRGKILLPQKCFYCFFHAKRQFGASKAFGVSKDPFHEKGLWRVQGGALHPPLVFV
jgi:hypothetical protein